VAGSRLHRVTWLLSTLGAAWLALQVAFGFGLSNLGDFDTWDGAVSRLERQREPARSLLRGAHLLSLYLAMRHAVSGQGSPL